MSDIWILLGLFAFIMAAVTLAGYLLTSKGTASDAPTSSGSAALAEPSLTPGRAAFVDIFRSIGEAFPGANREENPYRKKLSLAGYRWPSAVPVYYGIKFATTALFSGLAGVASLTYSEDTSMFPIAMVCSGALGWMIPDRILSSRIKARAARVRAGLPAALDLLVLGLEAGQSLDQSIADTSRGLRHTHADLSAELAQLYLELRAGNSRAQAFRDVSLRTNEPELRKLMNVLIDSDRFGVTLGPSLRSHNKYLRTRFRQRAQESARKIGVKLIFPVFFLIFPSVLLVTLGPAVIMMMTQLRNIMK
jgi:tight adherence protein C